MCGREEDQARDVVSCYRVCCRSLYIRLASLLSANVDATATTEGRIAYGPVRRQRQPITVSVVTCGGLSGDQQTLARVRNTGQSWDRALATSRVETGPKDACMIRGASGEVIGRVFPRAATLSPY